ncbi:MAG: Mom family adenine methylcarbamoylation protein [Chloroflexota bacterium]
MVDISRAPVVQQKDAPRPAERGRCDSDPGAPLDYSPKKMTLKPIPYQVARALLERGHYLHSISAGTVLLLGVFIGERLLGVAQFTCGSRQAHCIVEGAQARDCITLARLWLSDELPTNSESRVLAVSLRLLRKGTPVKFVVTYADPEAGHLGRIYQASNWLYLGQSWGDDPIDLGDGRLRPARTLSNRYGSSALPFLRQLHPQAQRVPVPGKHKYVFFVDPSWRARLRLPILPYPKEFV